MTTNFYPLSFRFEDGNYNILKIPAVEGLLQELRSKYNETHSFFQIGDYIYSSNKRGDDLPFGEIVFANIFEDQRITSALVKHVFFRTFREKYPQYIPLNFYPFVIQSGRPENDLVREALPDDLKDRIAFKKHIEIHLRVIQVNKNPVFGFVINTPRNWVFDVNCQDMVNEGFDIMGMEVLHSQVLPGLKDVLAPDETFIGIIQELKDEIGIVNTNEGIQGYPLKSLYLKKSHRNILAYLTFRLGSHEADRVFEHISSIKEDINDLRNAQSEIQVVAKLISKFNGEHIQYRNRDGFIFTISDEPELPDNAFKLTAPNFIFDPAKTKIHKGWPDVGLENYGPYDSNRFSPKEPKILAICHKENRGFFSGLVRELIDGIPEGKYFKKGLKKKYDLHNVSIDDREITSYSYESYDAIIKDLDQKPDLALIEIPSEYRGLKVERSPYYLLKARLLAKEIPVQFVTTEMTKNTDKFFRDSSLNAMALQIYAKLGGVPWVLETTQSWDRELVIGISSSNIRNNAYSGNDQYRVVGISTFFSSDGQYLLANKMKDVPFDEYFGELLKSLRSSFEELEKRDGWRERDTIRLIFHIFKPIKNVEYEVISSLIREFVKYKINFAFVTISKSHPFLLFDPSQQGKTMGTKSKKIGQFIPQRGSNLILDEQSCLVQMLGTWDIKTPKHGSSTPLLVSIRLPEGDFDISDIEDLLFSDLNYVVQQIYHFTHLSWRSFLNNEKPATMLYAHLISNLLGNLRKIDSWQPDAVNFNLKTKKWFL